MINVIYSTHKMLNVTDTFHFVNFQHNLEVCYHHRNISFSNIKQRAEIKFLQKKGFRQRKFTIACLFCVDKICKLFHCDKMVQKI